MKCGKKTKLKRLTDIIHTIVYKWHHFWAFLRSNGDD